MKNKIIALLLVATYTLSTPILCYAETYSDDFVSFEYSPDINCYVSRYARDTALNYTCFTKMNQNDIHDISAGLRILNTEDYEQSLEIQSGTWKEYLFTDVSDDYCDKKIIVDGEFPEVEITYKDNSGDIAYMKLLGCTDTDIVIATCRLNKSLPDVSDACKAFYDSAEISDYYLNNGYSSADESEIETIFSNVILSDQAYSYLHAAIDVLEQYLSFEMDADTASEQIESITNRCRDYAETSDYIYDSYISSELYVTHLDIDLGDDSGVYETLQDLQSLTTSDE